jgi:replicative DNA helicase|tara:strand:- start:546 stop:1901 length:1356 start_codon:yes stop_codon:yes gene_type:complete
MKNKKDPASDLIIERYLPHNFIAEKIVLGNLLVSSEAIEITLKTLNVNAFYFKTHQEIYKILILLYESNKKIDITTVTTYSQDMGVLDKIGGISVLLELVNQVPNFINMETYISLLQDKYLRRTLIGLGYQIINSSYITNISLESIINNLESEVFELTKHNENNKQISSSAELFSHLFNDLKNRSNKNTIPGLSSGFHDLDALTHGFQNSDLIIIAGRPSMGKTAFCLNIAANVIKKSKLPVLFFSLEMSKEQLVYRLLATETSISNMRLRSANIRQPEWDLLNSKVKEFSQLPLFIDDTSNVTILEIKAKIKNILIDYSKIGIIIIDYLQLMESNSSFNKNSNRVQELSQITRSLKNLAKEFKVPIIVLSQLSRNVETRINKRPILSDLRESGSIEQDADVVLMLYRDQYYNLQTAEPNITELILTKHRNGPIGISKLKFDPEYTRFENL